MNVDEALQQPGQLVAVWDDAAVDEAWLGIYVASDSGVKLLAHERMDDAARDRRMSALRQKQLPIGATSGGEFVWAATGEQFTAWNLSARLFTAGKREVVVGGARVADVARVTSFVDANDLGHRGVRVDRASGGQLVLVEEHDPTAELDPTYNRDNLALDAAWASALGRDLAKWFGVAHDDQI